MDTSRKLYRSERDKMIAGVCGGLAEHFGVDSTIVRVLFVVLALLNGIGVLLYLGMWLLVPRESRTGAEPWQTVREGGEEMRERAGQAAGKAREAYERWRGGPPTDSPKAESK